ncbi:type II secretion system F family protein [Candidatus Pacearchaeota archaeon]|nr:type II secretion system F family protein [Candidatus Pacearchaeota archaeon]
MEFKNSHWIGIMAAFAVFIVSLFFVQTAFFFFLIGIAVIIGVTPIVLTTINETKADNEKEEMFLEFARNLVEGVKTGTPISKSIINIQDKPYGVLSENIQKLANQIYMGIPLQKAFQIFARDVNNKTVSRAITLIGQAEKSGGDIGMILESVAGAVSTSDKLKKERKAVISGLVMQGYIIFFVFIGITIIMQFQIVPMVTNIGGLGVLGSPTGNAASTNVAANQLEVANAFLYLLLIQGLFSGLAIGKLAERKFKAGIKHSFILMLCAFLASSGSNLLLGA